MRFITISPEFCRFSGPFLHLWHHQIHICIDRLCRCLSGEAITLKGHSVSFPALHFSLLLRQRWEHQAPLPFLVTSLSGRVESVTVGIGNRERNSLQRKRLAGISASLLLCCCYRRVATAAACDSLRTSDDVGAGMCAGWGYPVPRIRGIHSGSEGAVCGLFPRRDAPSFPT